jgi:hypothetical protein
MPKLFVGTSLPHFVEAKRVEDCDYLTGLKDRGTRHV